MSEVTAKATRVQRLLEDKDLQQAFTDVESALFERFKSASVTDGATLKDLKLLHLLLDSLKANLHKAIQDGKLEVFEIEQRKKVPYLGDLVKWRKKQA